MECFGGGVNRMVCGMGRSGVVGLERVMGGEDVKSGWVGL